MWTLCTLFVYPENMNTARVNLTISPAMLRRADKAAKRLGLSRNGFIRLAITAATANQTSPAIGRKTKGTDK
jgi:uncharacterized protein (DUF1778 family)